MRLIGSQQSIKDFRKEPRSHILILFSGPRLSLKRRGGLRGSGAWRISRRLRSRELCLQSTPSLGPLFPLLPPLYSNLEPRGLLGEHGNGSTSVRSCERGRRTTHQLHNTIEAVRFPNDRMRLPLAALAEPLDQDVILHFASDPLKRSSQDRSVINGPVVTICVAVWVNRCVCSRK